MTATQQLEAEGIRPTAQAVAARAGVPGRVARQVLAAFADDKGW